MRPLAITDVRAREILDCRGLPTVQVDVTLEDGSRGRADVPAGRSTGAHEAAELRDGGTRFGGFGVTRAVDGVNHEIADRLGGVAPSSQRTLDLLLCEIDGTEDKSRLGGNALSGVSLAYARALADAAGVELYQWLNADAHVLPVPQVNLINGGRHASNDLDFQEFIIMPVGVSSFRDAMALSTEVNLHLFDLVIGRYGKLAGNVGDEGGCAPPITDPREALELLHVAVDKAGYAEAVQYGLDCAATHLYDPATSLYRVSGQEFDREALIGLYAELSRDFNVVSMEDPLQEDDFEGLATITAELGIQVVGDDVFVTNPRRVREGALVGACNALLFKFNQVGTLSEALDAASVARQHGYAIVVSERSGETEDPVIADLAVALNAGQIKTGAPVRSERVAKYNRLLLLEEQLGAAAVYAGRDHLVDRR